MATYSSCPNSDCGSTDSNRAVYRCKSCGFEGCWDKWGGGCWPKNQVCPSCKAYNWEKAGNIG